MAKAKMRKQKTAAVNQPKGDSYPYRFYSRKYRPGLGRTPLFDVAHRFPVKFLSGRKAAEKKQKSEDNGGFFPGQSKDGYYPRPLYSREGLPDIEPGLGWSPLFEIAHKNPVKFRDEPKWDEPESAKK